MAEVNLCCGSIYVACFHAVFNMETDNNMNAGFPDLTSDIYCSKELRAMYSFYARFSTGYKIIHFFLIKVLSVRFSTCPLDFLTVIL